MQAPRLAAQSAFVSALGRISKKLLKYRARDLRSEWGCRAGGRRDGEKQLAYSDRHSQTT